MNFIYIVLKTFFSDFYLCILYYVYLLGFLNRFLLSAIGRTDFGAI